MALSDVDIRQQIAAGRVVLDPFNPQDIQPASIDVHLGEQFRVFRQSRYAFIDPTKEQEDLTELVCASVERPFILHPGEFVLGTTAECVTIPDDILARIEGKSSLGRIGLLIHSTAGYVDPGWHGYLTLELSNVANLPILLRPGMKIGQIALEEMSSPAALPYGSKQLGSHYQGQVGPTAAAPLSL
ncbi:MAG: dCTP deaminase [Coriobacteriales bacterium]|jgi:dCTP deaminase|nr:dCTP deaminase [Coriobacteriales bacterium]